MDDDLKLVEHHDSWAAAATITRLHAEIEALKSDVSDLVRAGSDEATENERLVKERDEARELIAGPMAWLDRWADHVGACAQGDRCTCGLTLARSEISVASRTLEGE